MRPGPATAKAINPIQTITHSLIARSVVILAEYSVTNADYASVTGPILTHLAQVSTTDSTSPSVIVHGRHRIHVLPRDGLVFLAIAHDTVGVELMQKMLGEVADRFIEEYGVGYEMPSIMIPLSMNAFSKQMSIVMVRTRPKPWISLTRCRSNTLNDQ